MSFGIGAFGTGSNWGTGREIQERLSLHWKDVGGSVFCPYLSL